MDFLKDIGNWISDAMSGIGNFFSQAFGGFGGGGGGGGFGGGAGSPGVAPPVSSPGVGAPPPMATPPFAPQASTTYPTPATNPFAVNSVQNQTMGALNRAAAGVVERMGPWGQAVAGPLVGATMNSAAYGMQADQKIAAAELRANGRGAISLAPHGTPMGPTPNMSGQFGAASGSYADRLREAKLSSQQAMIERGMNQAQTNVWQKLSPQVDHPGGAFGKLLSKF